MAFTKGVTAREQERKPGDPWAIGDEAAAWLQTHHRLPPWTTSPVTLIAIFRNGHKVLLDLKYRGIDDQGRHRLRADIPSKAVKLRVVSTMKIRYEGGDDHEPRQPKENLSA